MYGVDGRRDLTESTRDDLSGYAGARPVRIGNGAFDQRQNDVYGAVLDSILLPTRRSGRLPRRLWPVVQAQAECATRVWREPDQGIWEARGAPQRYVSSKLMCWIAMDLQHCEQLVWGANRTIIRGLALWAKGWGRWEAAPMTAEARNRLIRLQTERLDAVEAGVALDSYLVRLELAIDEARHDYAVAAVTEIAALRTEMSLPLPADGSLAA